MPRYEDQQAQYTRMAAALASAEIRLPESGELRDHMAIAEFANGVIKSCREAIHNELFNAKERD